MDRRRVRWRKRLSKEIIEVKKDYKVGLDSDKLGEWKVTLPLGKIYGDTDMILTFEDEYPFEPPKAYIPDIYHPNVYPGSQLCISILESRNQEIVPGEEGKSAAERWSPAMTVFALIQGIVSVLLDPNVDSPANLDANRDFMNLRQLRDTRRLKKEQEDAFNKALIVDELKQKRLAEVLRREEAEKKVKKEAREVEQARNESDKAEVASKLPPEPEEITTIRFRTPTETFVRRFLGSEPLSVLFLYLSSRGYRPGMYKVLSSYPRRDLACLSSMSTMVELKMVPQETLTLEVLSHSDSDD